VNRHNSAAWKRGLIGQLMFILLGGALLVAGIVISVVGMSEVFVKEDLAFLQLQREQIDLFNNRLVPLIAHDRAGFGGALISEGLLLLLISLWGYREGERWLWWSYCLGGLAGLLPGIGIHFVIGYVDWYHLLPAFAAVLLYLVGLVFAYPYLYASASASGHGHIGHAAKIKRGSASA
jgi:dihydroorotate dehydrogenase